MRYLRSSVLVAASVGLAAVWFVTGMLVSPVAPVLGESIVVTAGTSAARSTAAVSAPAGKSATSASPTPRPRPSATTATPPQGGASSVGAKRVRPGDVCAAGVSGSSGDLDDADDDDDEFDDDFDDDLCDD